MGSRSTTWPLLGPSVNGSLVMRGGKLSSARVKPAALLNNRSRFQIRSPMVSMSSGPPTLYPSDSLTIAVTSSPGFISKVENKQIPEASTNEVVFCKIVSQYGLSLVVKGSNLIGLPKCSSEIVY